MITEAQRALLADIARSGGRGKYVRAVDLVDACALINAGLVEAAGPGSSALAATGRGVRLLTLSR